MGDIINLNKARKAVDKSNKKRIARENTVSFGRTKLEKHASRTFLEKQSKKLEDKQLSPEDDPKT